MKLQEPTYTESLKLGWALFWRGVGSFLLLTFAVNALLIFLLPELTRTSPSLWVALFPLALATLFCAFLVMPFIVRKLLRTAFRGFHVRFQRNEPPL
ncbi:MAG: hypothetical protein M3M98_05055 [Nitrospirota bacterium]|nr:hypothetical protein [Nitrospirota bacterium]